MASTYLNRTQTAGNRRTFTISTWIKRSGLTAGAQIIGSDPDGSVADNFAIFDLKNTDALDFSGYESAIGSTFRLITDRLFRDTSAWYHIVFAVDTTQATASNRIKLYVNGVQETSFSTETYPSQNYETSFNNNSYVCRLGGRTNKYFDGSMAHIHFIDGTAYDSDTFGETDSTTGIWKPKTAPSVTYGTNGFFLKFENSGAFGTDSSGNSNTFTVNGTMTQTIDTPSNVFATINPLANSAGIGSISNGNLTTYNANVYETSLATLGFSSGKYYWEVKNTNQIFYTSSIGLANEQCDLSNNLGTTTDGWGYFFQGNADSGKTYNNSLASSVYQTTSNNDILSIAVDADAGKIWWGVNGTWVNSGDPANGTNAQYTNLSTNGFYFPAHTAYDGNGTFGNPVLNYNFGNGYFGTTAVSSAQNPDDGIGIFEYDVPTGYRALCTKSINAEEYS